MKHCKKCGLEILGKNEYCVKCKEEVNKINSAIAKKKYSQRIRDGYLPEKKKRLAWDKQILKEMIGNWKFTYTPR